MADNTEFAGLERLAPGEPLDIGFLTRNPTVIDRLLKIGAITHRHDNHAALVDPVTAPTATPANVGGTIPSDTELFFGYTFIDADGGETLMSDEVQVTTDPGLPEPTTAPDVALDHTAGTLLANTYYYAVTVTDGLGGETTIGPAIDITVDPGFATSRITISGLDDIMAEVGGTGWRLWRAVGAGEWHMMVAGVGASVVDDGSLQGDCDITPPTSQQTNSTNKVTVVVPGPAPTGAVSFNLYLSTDGSFEDPALVGNHLVADLGTNIVITGLDTLPGAPPPVSLTLPGAAKIDPDVDMVDFPWKRPVANAAALPAVGNTDGDIRETLDDHTLHIWYAAAWHVLIAGGSSNPVYPMGTVVGWQDAYSDTKVKLRGERRNDQVLVADDEFDQAAGGIGDNYAADGAGLALPTTGGNNTDAVHYIGVSALIQDGYVERLVTIGSANWTRTGVTMGHGRRGIFAWITSDGNLRLYWRDVDTGAEANYQLIAADPLPAAPVATDVYTVQLEKVGNHVHATVFQSKAVVAECEGDIPVPLQAEFGDLQYVYVGLADKWSNADAWTTDWLHGIGYQYHYELWADAVQAGSATTQSRRVIHDEAITDVALNALVLPSGFDSDWGDGTVAARYTVDYDKQVVLGGIAMRSTGTAPAAGDLIAVLPLEALPTFSLTVPVVTGDDDGEELGWVAIDYNTGNVTWRGGRSTLPATKHPYVVLDGINYRTA